MNANVVRGALTAGGLILLSTVAASACDGELHATAVPGGGSAAALQRAGVAPAGVAAAAPVWTRAPLQANATIPTTLLDARSLRAGVRPLPIEVVDEN